MKHNFTWQRKTALWGSAAVGIYCLIADWVLQPLHVRGWFQPVLAQLNSLSWLASFPAYVMVVKLGIREALSPPHRISTGTWWIVWSLNLVLWAVALRLLLRVIFPERSTEKVDATGTPGQSEARNERSAAPDP